MISSRTLAISFWSNFGAQKLCGRRLGNTVLHGCRLSTAPRKRAADAALITFAFAIACTTPMRAVTSRAASAACTASTASSTASYPALSAFLAHTSESYHLDALSEEHVRAALLSWYDVNRRRLPWRGDAPPYNGSTAGINSASAASASTGGLANLNNDSST